MKIGRYYVKHLIDPRRWWAVVLGWFLNRYLTFNYCEQVVYRSMVCPECFDQGKCISCGCKLPDKAMVPGDSCDKLNWGPMLPEDQWKQFKSDMGISFHIHYS